MKILIANDGMHAHFFERVGWMNAFIRSGIQCVMYNCKTISAFDVFDEYEPDIFIGQLYNLDSSTIKCLAERPHVKTAFRAGDYSNIPELMNDPNILKTTNEDLQKLDSLLKVANEPKFIYTHYTQQDINYTHELFVKNYGLTLVGIPMSADIEVYHDGKYDPSLECDIGFVGGYWPYKGQVIDKYLTPLCKDYEYSIKIFGNQPWPHVNQYCGYIEDYKVKDLFASAKICPNLSEPHSQKYGIDVNERAFKILSSGGFCIMDSVAAAKNMFGKDVVFAESPMHFEALIKHFRKDPVHRKEMQIRGYDMSMRQHTNYHRAALIAKSFKEEEAVNQIITTLLNKRK